MVQYVIAKCAFSPADVLTADGWQPSPVTYRRRRSYRLAGRLGHTAKQDSVAPRQGRDKSVPRARWDEPTVCDDRSRSLKWPNTRRRTPGLT